MCVVNSIIIELLDREETPVGNIPSGFSFTGEKMVKEFSAVNVGHSQMTGVGSFVKTNDCMVKTSDQMLATVCCL